MSTRSDRISAALSALPGVVFEPAIGATVWGTDQTPRLSAPAGSIEPVFDDSGNAVAIERTLTPAQAKAAFVDWLGRAYPGAVEKLLSVLGANEVVARKGTLGQTDEKGFFEKVFDVAQNVLPTLLQYKQQSEILDVQLDRARAGLPPLETGQYAPAVQIGLDQETIQRLADEAQSRASMAAGTLGQYLPWVLGAVGVYLVYRGLKGGRRRRR